MAKQKLAAKAPKAGRRGYHGPSVGVGGDSGGFRGGQDGFRGGEDAGDGGDGAFDGSIQDPDIEAAVNEILGGGVLTAVAEPFRTINTKPQRKLTKLEKVRQYGDLYGCDHATLPHSSCRVHFALKRAV